MRAQSQGRCEYYYRVGRVGRTRDTPRHRRDADTYRCTRVTRTAHVPTVSKTKTSANRARSKPIDRGSGTATRDESACGGDGLEAVQTAEHGVISLVPLEERGVMRLV